MTDLVRITHVQPLHDRWVRVRFTDGLVQEINLEPVFAHGALFAPIRDERDAFEQVRVNPETGTIEWPGPIDLDPDVLYGTHEAAGRRPLERRVVARTTN